MTRQKTALALFPALFALATAACHEHDTPPPESSSPSSTSPLTGAPTGSASVSASASGTAAAAASGSATASGSAGKKITLADEKAMGTHISFAAFTTPKLDEPAIRKAFDDALAEIRRIETLMTTWRPDSELSRVNAGAGKSPVAVSPETFDVVKEALHASEISEGAFDITFESLHGLWKFDQDLDPHPPTDAQIKSKLSLVGYKHVHLDPAARTVYLDQAGTKISLGGIAKGYAVDRASKVLRDAGLTSFYVQAGGDLFAAGTKPDGSPWSAGIRDPRGADGAFFALLPLSDHAFSTAGDYERSYVIDGKRYHHIIDPKTGKPATASRSVTIYAPTALLADEIDDAVFILGADKGLKLCESIDDVGCVIVDAHNNLHVSKRLQGKLTVTSVPTDAP